jgi:hypothetical protein
VKKLLLLFLTSLLCTVASAQADNYFPPNGGGGVINLVPIQSLSPSGGSPNQLIKLNAAGTAFEFCPLVGQSPIVVTPSPGNLSVSLASESTGTVLGNFSGSSGSPVPLAITGAGGITVSGTSDSIVVNGSGVSGIGTVTSFSSGNLSPLFITSVATSTSTPAQTFSLSNAAAAQLLGNPTGSTGSPQYFTVGTTDQLLGVAHTGGGLEGKTFIAGSGISVTPAAGSITIAATGGGGTVTSVTLTGDGVTSSSTPSSAVTASGTLPISTAIASANTVVAGPTSGSSSALTRRALVNADLPTSGVSAGSYTNSNITVNSQGIVTAASTGSGGGIAPLVNGGRIYVVTGSAYQDAPYTGHLYFGPATSNTITLYNGTSEVLQTFSEASYSLSSTSQGMYDVYVNSTSSTSVAESLVAWSNNTTQPTRDVQDGRLCKHSAPTYLFVGSIYVNGSNQTADWTGERWVSNFYNLAPKGLWASDSTSSWTNSTSSWQPANGNTTDGTGRFSWVCCSNLNGTVQISNTENATVASSGQYIVFGIGIDGTEPGVNSYGGIQGALTYLNGGGAGFTESLVFGQSYNSGAIWGYHYAQRSEFVYGSATVNGSNLSSPGSMSCALTGFMMN